MPKEEDQIFPTVLSSFVGEKKMQAMQASNRNKLGFITGIFTNWKFFFQRNTSYLLELVKS